MTQQIYAEWRNENSNRRYPFSDTALFKSEGGVAVPLGLVLDARVYNYGDSAEMYLSRISMVSASITFYVVDASQAAGSAVIALADLPSSGALAAALITTGGRPMGTLLVDSQLLRVLLTEDGAELVFSRKAMPFAVSAVVPMPRAGVSAFTLETGEVFSGHVWLVAGPGVKLSLDQGVVRVDTVGDPEWARRNCQGQTPAGTPRCLKTINGVRPDVYGNIGITSGSEKTDNVFRIEAGDGGLLVYAAGVRL